MVILTKETSLLISSLKPNTTYAAYVVAFTEAGQGNASEKVLFKTGETKYVDLTIFLIVLLISNDFSAVWFYLNCVRKTFSHQTKI